MKNRFRWIIPLAFCIVMILVVFWIKAGTPVNAQCKEPSSCKTCHEVQGVLPVANSGPWHVQHAVFDFCAVCHGGNPKQNDAALAHVDIKTKYIDMTGSCKNCHSSDLDTCVNTYAKDLGIDAQAAVKSAETATGSGGNALGFLGLNSADVSAGQNTPEKVGAAAETPLQAKNPENQAANRYLSLLLVALLAGGSLYVARNEGWLSKQGIRQISLVRWLLLTIKKSVWSPYTAGAFLGIICIASVWLSQHLTGASGGIASIASTLVNTLFSGWTADRVYFKFVMPSGLSWEAFLLIGIFFGGMLGAFTSGSFHLRWNQDSQWNRVFGPQPWKRFVIGFVGAAILQYGAGIAGGCTSGLTISGGMLLAPSAFLFMAGMFLSGIITALILYRRRY